MIVPALVLLGTAAIAPSIPAPPIAAYIVAFVCLGVAMIAAAACTPKVSWGVLAIAVLPIAIVVVVGIFAPPDWIAAPLVVPSLLAIGTLIGGAVGSRIQKPGYLIVVAALSALADAFSVLHPQGPTNQIVHSARAVALMVMSWPMLGTDQIAPVLGVGDVVFASIYWSACAKHSLSKTRTTLALAVGLIAAMLVVIASGLGIPVLPFFGVAIVIFHPQARRLEGRERTQAIVGVLALTLLFALLFVFR